MNRWYVVGLDVLDPPALPPWRSHGDWDLDMAVMIAEKFNRQPGMAMRYFACRIDELALFGLEE